MLLCGFYRELSQEIKMLNLEFLDFSIHPTVKNSSGLAGKYALI
jgi:hypothetical protein